MKVWIVEETWRDGNGFSTSELVDIFATEKLAETAKANLVNKALAEKRRLKYVVSEREVIA